ncbi:pentapeptide repeat-containing protein, partial [Gordonia alkanivorans]|uniref:pentapeptide repeat-containing protein n=1 Tax=Gordonia alkanivorans TaxID=84096 RepID=UPI001E420F3A
VFGGATFTGPAQFDRATFTGPTGFTGATFTGLAQFGGATFTGDTQFERATFQEVRWDGTRWSTTAVSTKGMAAATVNVDGAIVESPVRWDFTATHVSARGLRAVERLHLVVAGATVDLQDADLASGSLIEAAPLIPRDVPDDRAERHVAGGGTWIAIPKILDPDGRLRRPAGMALDAWLGHVLALMELDRHLTEKLSPQSRTTIKSLRRAHVAGVTLSGMNLRGCVFAAADGLDELVISGDNILATSRDGHGWA